MRPARVRRRKPKAILRMLHPCEPLTQWRELSDWSQGRSYAEVVNLMHDIERGPKLKLRDSLGLDLK